MQSCHQPEVYGYHKGIHSIEDGRLKLEKAFHRTAMRVPQ